MYNNEKKRCRVSFKCDSQTDLQNAKKDVMLALESLVSNISEYSLISYKNATMYLNDILFKHTNIYKSATTLKIMFALSV